MMAAVGRSCSLVSYGSSGDLQSTYGGGGGGSNSDSSDDVSGNCSLGDAVSCTRSDSVSSSSSSSSSLSSSSSSSSSSGNSDGEGGGDRAVVKWLKMFRTVIHQVAGDGRRSSQRPIKTILRPPITFKYVIGMSGLPYKVAVYPKYS